jgi:hypothetical protein
MGNHGYTKEMNTRASTLSLLAALGAFAFIGFNTEAATTLSIPSSPKITATAPAVPAHAGRGVVGKLDSNPWVPVAAILGTIAAGPFLRRYLAR